VKGVFAMKKKISKTSPKTTLSDVKAEMAAPVQAASVRQQGL
jgi:hypothetical protein